MCQDYNCILPVLIIELGHLILMIQRYPSKAQDGKLCFAGRVQLLAEAVDAVVEFNRCENSKLSLAILTMEILKCSTLREGCVFHGRACRAHHR
jgi:hypothetical protein